MASIHTTFQGQTASCFPSNSSQDDGPSYGFSVDQSFMDNLRPLGDFFNVYGVSTPCDLSEAQSRVHHNLSKFSSNYILIAALISMYAFLDNPILLLDIMLLLAGKYVLSIFDGSALVVCGYHASPSHLCTAFLGVTIPLGLMASPVSTLQWLVGMTSTAILGHAVFMGDPVSPENEVRTIRIGRIYPIKRRHRLLRIFK